MIENLICIKEKDLLQWACGESNILVSMPFFDYAMVDSTRQLVFALSGVKATTNRFDHLQCAG